MITVPAKPLKRQGLGRSPGPKLRPSAPPPVSIGSAGIEREKSSSPEIPEKIRLPLIDDKLNDLIFNIIRRIPGLTCNQITRIVDDFCEAKGFEWKNQSTNVIYQRLLKLIGQEQVTRLRIKTTWHYFIVVEGDGMWKKIKK